MQETRLGLHEVVVARPAASFVVASIGRKVRADDAWIGVTQRVVGETELVRLVAAQIVEHGVRGRDQPQEGRASCGLLEVEADAALVEVEGLEEMRIVLAQEKRSHATRGIAALGAVLDLDDLGAEVREVHRAEGSRAERLEGEHPQPGERQGGRGRPGVACSRALLRHHTGFRSMSWRAMMMRCISLVPSPMHISGASR